MGMGVWVIISSDDISIGIRWTCMMFMVILCESH